MSTLVLHRIRLPILVVAFAAATWSSCQAIGSFQTRRAFSSVTNIDHPPLPPAITSPGLSASALAGGCGSPAAVDDPAGCHEAGQPIHRLAPNCPPVLDNASSFYGRFHHVINSDRVFGTHRDRT
jgi:hypothetical protein